jgi:hypothetical protein
MHAFERWILRRYLANALSMRRFAKPPRSSAEIVAWIETHARGIGLPSFPYKSPIRQARPADRG